MALLSSLAKAVGLVALGARTVLADCQSFGVDFQNGGNYFQNSLSNANFTFVSQFEGCNNDTAFNVFVDNDGTQTLCSDTQLMPDDTNQLSTCPDEKSSLQSGNYSIVVFSNNADGDPIAYQRDFVLSVGPQSTSTYIPTITVSSTTTPIVNTTKITTSTLTTTLTAVTLTSPSVTVTPTTTVTPAAVTTTTTKAILTIKEVSISASIIQSTKTATATCNVPTKAKRDPVAWLTPTVGPWAKIFSAKYKREFFEEQKGRFVQERAERLALRPRAPDPQPLIVTDTNTADYITSTNTITAPAITATFINTATATNTVTPSPVVVLNGKTTAARITVTAPTPTKTSTQVVLATTTVSTKVITATVTITTKITPSSVAAACTSKGGILS
ncbi:hypothetical protein P280DRAFT_272282 [Massarina eburnea CBS 473.64]|uniref:Uncharacterized protein n=1 Tax=Massarina eburnea CBS 473.64 TaxID=1395130 RepID=A0A6A6S8G3_9PLEO|nr:hypothetical protein P280DRAFT_272282 [Massarina eburnea CBS 473.64]